MLDKDGRYYAPAKLKVSTFSLANSSNPYSCIVEGKLWRKQLRCACRRRSSRNVTTRALSGAAEAVNVLTSLTYG